MRNATLLFLVKKSKGQITDICLAMKKRGFGMGRWNGAGGKVTDGETIEEAALRETKEELTVLAKDIKKVAELSFDFPHNPAWDQVVHVYFTESWDGEPGESEEMEPEWFKVSDIPYSEMWPDDPLWLPRVLAGEKLRAAFSFGEGDIIIKQSVETLSK